jgi:hypothetical protein
MNKLLALILIAASTVAFAGQPLFESYLTVSPTNAVGTYQTNTGGNDWINLNTLYVVAPAAKTGTVTFAALRGGAYFTVATVAVSNSTDSAVIVTSAGINVPICGPVRITATQTGTTTNDWKYGLFFEDGK